MTGREIRELRKKLGLTQEEFAQLLGVGYTTVNRWENDKSEPRGQVAQVLSKLKELVEEAEEGDQLSIEEIRNIVKDINSGKLISKLANVLPSTALGLLATSGITGFIAALSSAMLLKRLKKENKKKSKTPHS